VGYVFDTQAQYLALTRQLEGLEWAQAFYSPPGFIAIHREVGANEVLVSTTLHEAVHAYLDRHVVRPGTWLPVWLNEGLAEYVANSEIRKGKLIPGGFRQNRLFHGPGWTAYGWSEAKASSVAVKKALRKGEAIPLEDLVAARDDEFYGDKRHLFYTQSWMFVHFLRHGKPDWAAKAFPTFVLYVAEGYAPSDAFAQAYGVAPRQLEGDFRKYAEQF
jgi:hypothetical protein